MKKDFESRILNFSIMRKIYGIGDSVLKEPITFKFMLKQKGYSDRAVEEIWKWYDFTERKGINF